MARPGVMLYFDILEPLRVLPDGDKGRILQAILEYGKDGTDPQLEGMAALAWGFIKPRLDRDREEYRRAVLRRQYATACRERKKKNEPELTFEQWLQSTGNHLSSPDTNDDQWYPTTNTNTTTDTTTTTNTDTTADTDAAEGADSRAAAAAEEKKLKRLHGDLGQGVVNLSEYQIQRLLDEMGLEMFDHYVKKLSDFILSQGASVKNHYQTILKWWTQDSGV